MATYHSKMNTLMATGEVVSDLEYGHTHELRHRYIKFQFKVYSNKLGTYTDDPIIIPAVAYGDFADYLYDRLKLGTKLSIIATLNSNNYYSVEKQTIVYGIQLTLRSVDLIADYMKEKEFYEDTRDENILEIFDNLYTEHKKDENK